MVITLARALAAYALVGFTVLAISALTVSAQAVQGSAQAAAPTEPPNPLTSVKTLKCRFPAATSAVWKGSEVVAQAKTQEMLFDITAIDVQDGTAEFHGTAGRVYVSAVLSGWSIYFVEQSVGQLNTTTVFAQEAAPKRLKAVHSRHGYVQMQVGKYIAEPSVSQNYGDCEITG